METFVNKVIRRLDEEGLIKDDPIIYKYGLMLIINEKITALILILISIPFHKVLHSILYMCCFSYLREYIGGYHANTYWECRCTYIFLYLINLFLLGKCPLYFYLITAGVCLFILSFIIPVEFPTKPLSKEEKQVYKKESIKRILIYLFSIIVFSFIKVELSELLCAVFITVSILAVIQFYRNKKGVKHDEKFDAKSFT